MTDRAARKLVPRSYKGWCKEVIGIRLFLELLPDHLEDQGEDWVKELILYHRERLAHLLKNKPDSPLVKK